MPLCIWAAQIRLGGLFKKNKHHMELGESKRRARVGGENGQNTLCESVEFAACILIF